LKGDPHSLEAALGEYRQSLEAAGRGRGASCPVQVARALAYIHGHLFEPWLNAEAVRSGCGVRNHNLTTQFHRTVGVPLRTYIEILRLEVAAQLLHSLPTNAFWIAAAVGYESYETFCRAFRRRYRASPREFRSQELTR
jgi:AraC-like DNA-binding protein